MRVIPHSVSAIFVAVLAAHASLACAALAPADVRVRVRFPRSVLAFAPAPDGGGGEVATLRGQRSVSRLGEWAWPVVAVTVAIPAGQRVTTVSCVDTIWTPIEGSHTLAPASQWGPRGWEALPVEETRSWATVEYVGDGYLRGYHLAQFLVRPLAYSSRTHTVRLAESAVLALRLAPVSVDGVALRRRETSEAGEHTRRLVQRLVENPEAVQPAWRAGAPELARHGVAPTFRPTLDGSAVDYVVVTQDSLIPAFQAFADWKTSEGIQTVVRGIEWITATYATGADRAETIRRFLQDAYTNWGTTDVLLGGDVGLVPYRSGRSTYNGGDLIPTDLYFQCLDRNWNADGDSLFGEAPLNFVGGDNVDMYPELNVGRVTVANASDVAAWVAKVRAFQDAPPADFCTKALLLGEVLTPSDWIPGDPRVISLDGASILEAMVPSIPSGFTVTRQYQNTAGFPGSLAESRGPALDSLNAGYALVEHMGHGYINTLSVGDGELLNIDIDALHNTGRAGIVYAVNCNSASFEYNSIGERFLLNPNGGAVDYIGATRYDYPTTLLAYQNLFFQLLLQDSVYTVGDAHSMSKSAFVANASFDNADRWTQFSVNLLGDPTLTTYRHAPRPLSVQQPGSVVLGADHYDVSVTVGSGTPVAGARVVAQKAGEAFAVGQTDVTGHASVPFVPQSAGAFAVSVIANSELPWSGSATVTAAAGAALTLASQTLNDDSVPPSSGNGDGAANPGETVELWVSARNAGAASTASVTASLKSTDIYATVADSAATVGAVPAGATVNAADPFTVVISPAAPVGYSARLSVTFRDAALNAWTRPLQLPLYAAALDVATRALLDTLPGDNRNGIADLGETLQYTLGLRNFGIGAASGVVLHLKVADPTTQVLDSLSTLGLVPAGGTVSGDEFRFKVLQNGTHRFVLWGTNSTGQFVLARRLVDLVAPAVPKNLTATSGSADISIVWTASVDADVEGAWVYRGTTPGGPYVKINSVLDYRTALFHDYGLQPLTRYYYRISAVDSSANESAQSSELATTTGPAVHLGWPLPLGTPVSAATVLANIDGSPDGSMELVTGGTRIYAVHPDGTEAYDGDHDPSTLGPINASGVSFSAGPSIDDIDGDGTLEICAASYDASVDSSTVYVFEGPTGAVRPGWPKKVWKLVWGSPALGDIDGDGHQEVVLGSSQGFVYAWHDNGVEVRNGDFNSATDGVFQVTSGFIYGTAALVDLDHDGVLEIVLGSGDGKVYAWNADGTSVPGWPFVSGGAITASPAVGDIEGDGHYEIAIGSMSNVFNVLNENGTVRWTRWFTEYTDARTPSPAFADINGDGFQDVVVASTAGKVYVFDRNGQSVPGWTTGGSDGIAYGTGTSGVSQSSPVVADVNGDGHPDVMIGAEDAALYGFSSAGAPLAGFPIHLAAAVRGTPLVWDVDGNGTVEIAVAGYDQTFYLWDIASAFVASACPWPMFHHDDAATGRWNANVLAVPVIVTPIPPPFPAIFDCAIHTRGVTTGATPVTFRVSVPGTAGGAARPGTLTLFDVRGRRVATPFAARVRPGELSVSWDGRDASGERIPAGVVFARWSVGAYATVARLVVLP